MKTFLHSLVLSFCLLKHFSGACDNGEEQRFKRVCYFENWARYRPGEGKMMPEDIDPSLCTHIMYGFAVLDSATGLLKPHDAWADINGGGYKKITNFKRQGAKVMLALGGWADSAGNKYSSMVGNPAARKKFIRHAVTFLQTHNFDGLDLDWEFPGCWHANCGSGPASDKQNFALWAKELSAALKPKGMLLSAAVSASKPVIDKAYDLVSLGKSLDFINVMSYDFHGYYEHKTGHHAPLYKHPQDSKNYLNVDFCMKYFHQKGAPKEKLVMGMPTYGQSFTLSSASNNGLNAGASGAGNAGPFTRQAGLLAYNEICHKVKKERWTVRKQPEMGPYAFKGTQWVGYDDVDMIKKKSQYVKDNGYGGGMIWALGMDDFKNRCGEGPYPLLTAIKEVLTGCAPSRPTQRPNRPAATTESPWRNTFRPTMAPTKAPTGGSSSCVASKTYMAYPGMGKWCITNCKAGLCPKSHCVCPKYQ